MSYIDVLHEYNSHNTHTIILPAAVLAVSFVYSLVANIINHPNATVPKISARSVNINSAIPIITKEEDYSFINKYPIISEPRYTSKIQWVYKIVNPYLDSKFNSYVQSKNSINPNIAMLWHGTTLYCNLCEQTCKFGGNITLCASELCNMCSICKEGFKKSKGMLNGNRFSKGSYFSDDLSKCLPFAKQRVLLLSKVYLGKTFVPRSQNDFDDLYNTELYDSVSILESIYFGASQNEYCIHEDDGILPMYLVKFDE